jgi:hypothetical protein
MANNLVMVILDSCRYDSFIRARTPNMDCVGHTQRRWSYASWTAPSHYAFLMGLTPHQSPREVYASEVYKKDFVSWIDRLGIEDLGFQSFIPYLSLPKVLKDAGYHCVARVSMPVLNGFTLVNKFFDDYKLMGNHNSFETIIEEMDFSSGKPRFYFINLGETHYPYMLDGKDLPYIPGVHGAAKSLASGGDGGGRIGGAGMDHETFISPDVMRRLHDQQVRCAEHVDRLFARLLDKVPANTHLMVMADHGEAFGEDGYFGHGPVMHEKVFEVPFLEGLRP